MFPLLTLEVWTVDPTRCEKRFIALVFYLSSGAMPALDTRWKPTLLHKLESATVRRRMTRMIRIVLLVIIIVVLK